MKRTKGLRKAPSIHELGRSAAVGCPDCGKPSVAIGSIPPTDVFGGRTLERLVGGGVLHRCPECHLGFRVPRPSKEELDALYVQGSAETWSSFPEDSVSWRLARALICKFLPEGASILDVGCFDGGFLEPLVKRFDCHGIEIHREARARAKRKGIRIIGTDFEDMRGRTFDCITAHDVIEHVESPRAFVERCLSSLNPGGVMVISTGNLDSLTFRLMGARYWYSAMAEHISFIGPRWVEKLAAEHGLRCERMLFFAHRKAPILHRIREGGINLLYRFAPSFFRWLRHQGLGGKNTARHPELADYPPVWDTARDHFMIVLARK